jgi:hypothetical protein
MIRLLAAPLIGLVVLADSAASVDAGPISGMFGGDSILTPTSTPGIFIQAYTGDGGDSATTRRDGRLKLSLVHRKQPLLSWPRRLAARLAAVHPLG